MFKRKEITISVFYQKENHLSTVLKFKVFCAVWRVPAKTEKGRPAAAGHPLCEV